MICYTWVRALSCNCYTPCRGTCIFTSFYPQCWNINLFTAEKGRIELVCISIPQLLPDDSQPTPAGGEPPGFSFMSSLDILRENAPATDLFIFEMSVSVVGQESQLVGLCTYTVLFMGLSFYVGETKLDLPPVLVLGLAFTLMNELLILQSAWNPIFLPSPP